MDDFAISRNATLAVEGSLLERTSNYRDLHNYRALIPSFPRRRESSRL